MRVYPKVPAVRFRGKVYSRHPHHADAIDAAMERLTENQRIRAYDRISEGKETIVFGFVDRDGAFEESSHQAARLKMYGFD